MRVGLLLLWSLCGYVTLISPALAGFPAEESAPILQIDSGGHGSLIRDIIFTLDGKYIVSAGDDKLIRVWDIATQKTVRIIRGQVAEGDEGKIFAMALSPDNRWLAVGGWMHPECAGRCGDIRLYDFATGKLLALLKGHSGAVYSLAFSPDSNWLVSGSSDFNAIIWQVEQQKKHTVLNGHTDYILAVAFTPDSKRVVTGSYDHTLKLWQRDDGVLIATLNGHEDKVQAVAVTPDNRIVSGSWDHSIRLWDGNSGQYLETLVADQGTGIGALSVSVDGRFVLTGSDGSDFHTHLYRLSDGNRIHRYQGHDNIVIATAFSPDGTLAATAGGSDKSIHLWSVATGMLQKRMAGVGKVVWAVGFSEDGERIGWGKSIKSGWIVNDYGSLEFQLRLPSNQQSLGSPQVLSAADQVSQTFIRAYSSDLSSANARELSHQKGGSYGYDAILTIKQQGKTINTIERDSTNGLGHWAYTFTNDGQHIISGGGNGILTLYDRDGNQPHDFVGHTGVVWSVAVSPDGKLLVSGADDQTLRLWCIASQELLLTLFHGDDGEWVAWTPQGYYTASINGDQMIGWQINRGVDQAADYVSAVQLRKHFYRPDIVADTLRLGSALAAISAADNTGFVLADLLKKPLPIFDIAALEYIKTAGKPLLRIALKVDPNTPIDDYRVYVDDRYVAEVTSRSTQRQAHDHVMEVPLPGQGSQLRVVAINQSGETGNTRSLQIPAELIPKGSQKGDLYLLSIGINQYPFLSRGLKYARQDASDFHELIKDNAGIDFHQVHEWLLTDQAGQADQQPTWRNIENALKRLTAAKANDSVIVFLAGHGEMVGSDYYFLSQDSQQDGSGLLTGTAVKWQLIQNTLSTTKGQRLLVVDTCYSERAFNPRLVKDAYDERIAIFSATDGAYAAIELDQQKHGALTFAMLEGMRGKANYPGEDSRITLQELDIYVGREVKKLTNDRQKPRVVVGHQAKDYVISRY